MRYGRWCLVLALALPATAADLPEFSLKDPADTVHTHRTLLERGAVVIVTIPNVKHGDLQSHYVKHLEQHLPADGPRLVIVEDLSQSILRGMAVRSMKAKYRSGESTLLLLDEDGALRRSLQVPADETVVLVFDADGRLLQRTAGWTTADEVADATKQVVRTVRTLAENARREGVPAVAEK
jgi:hypothetical protein